MSFTVPRTDLRTAREALQPLIAELGIRAIADDPEMGKVSVVGAGMKTHPGVAARVFSTLGRGGSDTTAVALAAAMEAEVCEIYTDVAGVFSADPRIVPDARKLPVVSFE